MVAYVARNMNPYSTSRHKTGILPANQVLHRRQERWLPELQHTILAYTNSTLETGVHSENWVSMENVGGFFLVSETMKIFCRKSSCTQHWNLVAHLGFNAKICSWQSRCHMNPCTWTLAVVLADDQNTYFVCVCVCVRVCLCVSRGEILIIGNDGPPNLSFVHSKLNFFLLPAGSISSWK
jgi:hypothetical protein